MAIKAKLDLKSLFDGRPGLTQSEGGHLAEAAAVCYEIAGKSLPKEVLFTGRRRKKPEVVGPKVTAKMRRTYADTQEATEWGACGVAAVALEVLEGLTIYERSPKNGGGFDYYLIPKVSIELADDENFFANPTHVLEVSGTLQNDEREMDLRVEDKLKRFKKKPPALPAMVLVVDFFFSKAKLVSHE